MDLLHPAGLDRRDQRGMRIQREVAGDLALQAQLLAVGRQQKLDRGGAEADAVIQPLHAIRRVDALDREHRGQDLPFGDGGRIARKQRLDEERLVGLDDEMHAVCRNVDARHLVDDFVDLGDHDAVLERCRLDDGRRVLGVRAGIEVALAVGADGGDQRDVRGKVDEVAREQLEIGVNRAELDLAAEQHARDARRLRAGIGIVELLRDAAIEQIEMFRQHNTGLHHVQIIHLGEVDRQQRAAEQIRLLLVVAFQANPVARPNDGFHQPRGVAGLDDLAARQPGAGFDAGIARFAVSLPGRHCPVLDIGVHGHQHVEIS